MNVYTKTIGGCGKLITRSRGLLYRVNIKPRTFKFEITEIDFGNFLGLPTTIQDRTEAMLSEKEESGAMLFKTNR